jgi:hypothetical protein
MTSLTSAANFHWDAPYSHHDETESERKRTLLLLAVPMILSPLVLTFTNICTPSADFFLGLGVLLLSGPHVCRRRHQ